MTDVRRLVCEIAAVIERTRVDLSQEVQAQAGLAAALSKAFADRWPVEREVALTAASRIDIMVGPVGIEVKRRSAGRRATVRQLSRYAACEQVQGLVLASNRAFQLPPTLNGKPLAFASLGRAWM